VILADSSIWIDHIRRSEQRLVDLLEADQVYMHAFVIGEIALGSIKDRPLVIRGLMRLPQALRATDNEVLRLIEQSSLHGKGVGFADVHLLAAALLTSDTLLWTRDKRLAKVAEELGVAFRE
jgi:predicted nucleic acid-binding protein